MDSIESPLDGEPVIPGIVEDAAAGRLPGWAVIGQRRREHSARVADLMGEWAEGLGLSPTDCTRWRAAGWLHDALRDASPAILRPLLSATDQDLPDPLLHGPAAAARLHDSGVEDEELLTAITYHTTGHPSLGPLGRALYLADTLEPGRTYDPTWSASLRARLPGALDSVLREVVARRIGYTLELGYPLRPESIELWDSLQRGR